MKLAAMFALQRMGVLLLYSLAVPPLIIGIALTMQVIRTHVDPLREWFYPLHLHVPDFCTGDDPHIIYDRIIKRPFLGTYHTQFDQVVGDHDFGFPICEHQSDTFMYYPKQEIRTTPRLSDFAGRSCVLREGKYRQESTWHPLRTGYVDETTSLVSNVFTVFAKSDPQCKGVHE